MNIWQLKYYVWAHFAASADAWDASQREAAKQAAMQRKG